MPAESSGSNFMPAGQSALNYLHFTEDPFAFGTDAWDGTQNYHC